MVISEIEELVGRLDPNALKCWWCERWRNIYDLDFSTKRIVCKDLNQCCTLFKNRYYENLFGKDIIQHE